MDGFDTRPIIAEIQPDYRAIKFGIRVLHLSCTIHVIAIQ